MATVTRFAAGSVVKAVTEGSQDGESLNRVRRSAGASCWTSMNSGMVIARVTASTKRRRRGTHQMYRVAPEDSLKVADTRRAAGRLPSRRETSETL